MLSTAVYNTSGEKVSSVKLPEEIFGRKPNKPLMAQAVRVYLSNQRQAGAKTKTRGQRRGSSRKIYRQKGTGRARHGDIRAPIFVKGGRAHGPTGEQNFKLKLSKKMRRQALFSALSGKFNEKRIKVVTGFEKIQPKTKAMTTVLEKFKLEAGREKLILILPETLINLNRSAGNIPNVQLVLAKNINVYQVLNNNWLLILKPSIKILEEIFIKS